MSDVRVYHPTGAAFYDVATADVKGWTDQGWTKKSPGLVDDAQHLPVGEGFTAALVPDAEVHGGPAPEPVQAVEKPTK